MNALNRGLNKDDLIKELQNREIVSSERRKKNNGAFFERFFIKMEECEKLEHWEIDGRNLETNQARMIYVWRKNKTVQMTNWLCRYAFLYSMSL